MGSLRQLIAVFLIYLREALIYPAQGFIWILTDGINAVTMPLVFVAAVGNGNIHGFARNDFVLYYLCMLMVGSFVTCHFMWDIAFEIKEGQFTNQLLRPIKWLPFMLARNLSWRCFRILLTSPLALLLIFCYRSFLTGAHVYLGWEFWVALILGHLVSAMFVLALALVALFVQEATAIFELYYVPMLFLSGQLFPVAILPPWASTLAKFFPFYYTSGLPTEIAVGRVTPAQAIPQYGIQLAWIVGSYVAHKVLWHRGVRHYSGVGM